MRHSWLTPCIFDSNCFYNETIPDLSCQAEVRLKPGQTLRHQYWGASGWLQAGFRNCSSRVSDMKKYSKPKAIAATTARKTKPALKPKAGTMEPAMA